MMRFPLQLVLQRWKKRNPLQVARDMFQVAISNCDLQCFQKHMAILGHNLQ